MGVFQQRQISGQTCICEAKAKISKTLHYEDTLLKGTKRYACMILAFYRDIKEFQHLFIPASQAKLMQL